MRLLKVYGFLQNHVILCVSRFSEYLKDMNYEKVSQNHDIHVRIMKYLMKCEILSKIWNISSQNYELLFNS